MNRCNECRVTIAGKASLCGSCRERLKALHAGYVPPTKENPYGDIDKEIGTVVKTTGLFHCAKCGNNIESIDAGCVFCSVPKIPNTYSKPLTGNSKYHVEILPGVWVDVYDVIAAFGVTDAGLQHALKKILATGKRGHKSEAEDRKDILDSVVRSNERFELFNNGEIDG